MQEHVLNRNWPAYWLPRLTICKYDELLGELKNRIPSKEKPCVNCIILCHVTQKLLEKMKSFYLCLTTAHKYCIFLCVEWQCISVYSTSHYGGLTNRKHAFLDRLGVAPRTRLLIISSSVPNNFTQTLCISIHRVTTHVCIFYQPLYGSYG